jgi:hypothetical protein
MIKNTDPLEELNHRQCLDKLCIYGKVWIEYSSSEIETNNMSRFRDGH